MRSNKRIRFTFRYSRAPGLRKKKFPKGVHPQIYPLLPIKFYWKGRETKIIEALVDSGSDKLHIRKEVKDFLNLSKGKKVESSSMGGKYTTYETKVGLVIGRGGREYDFGIVDAIYPDKYVDAPILIGREPVFEEFRVIFDEFNKKFKLIPKEEIQKKKK